MNKSDLIDLIYKRLGKYKKNDVKKVVNGAFNAITYGLKNGEKIEIRGLGTFKVKKKPARIVRNPKNGNIVKAEERKTVHFKIGKLLKNDLFSKK